MANCKQDSQNLEDQIDSLKCKKRCSKEAVMAIASFTYKLAECGVRIIMHGGRLHYSTSFILAIQMSAYF